MTNMYHPLFFMTFCVLGIGNKISGRCDNCGNSVFKSSVKDFIYLRECRKCGMKKII